MVNLSNNGSFLDAELIFDKGRGHFQDPKNHKDIDIRGLQRGVNIWKQTSSLWDKFCNWVVVDLFKVAIEHREGDTTYVINKKSFAEYAKGNLVQPGDLLSEDKIHTIMSNVLSNKALSLEDPALVQRMRQLDAVFREEQRFEAGALVPQSELFKMARLIESERRVESLTHRHFGAKEGLVRSVVLPRGGKEAFILAKRTFSKIKGEGTSKKAIAAAALPLQQVGASHPTYLASTFSKQASDVSDILEEGAKYKKMKGLPGIVQVHHVSKYHMAKTKKDRANILLEPFVGDLGVARRSKQHFTPLQKLQIAKGIVQGLTNMHATGHMHGDFKLANCLYRYNPAEVTVDPVTKKPDYSGASIVAKVGDFGLMTSIAAAKNAVLVEAPGDYNQGIYGSTWETPPELIGEICFSGDHEKVEVFALGVMLFQLSEGRDPAWVGKLSDLRLKATSYMNHKLSKNEYLKFCRETKAAVELLVEASIEKRLPQLLAKIERGEVLSDEEKLSYIMCQCFELDPAKRPAFATLKGQMDAILPEFQVV